MFGLYAYRCTSCSFQLKNFNSINFLDIETASSALHSIHTETRLIGNLNNLKPSIVKIVTTLGFGIISILRASASTCSLMSFNFTHLSRMVQSEHRLHVSNPDTEMWIYIQVIGVENLEFFNWLKLVYLKHLKKDETII